MNAQPKPNTAPQFFPLDLGRIVATPGALDAMGDDANKFKPMLDRHSWGDWGDVCAEDFKLNNASLHDGSRIVSAYPIDPTKPCKGFGENCLWIITEATDHKGRRPSTTILLPSEY